MDTGTGLKVVRRDKFLASDGLRTPDRPAGSPVPTVTTKFRLLLHSINWSQFRRVGQSLRGVLDAKVDCSKFHRKVSKYSRRTRLNVPEKSNVERSTCQVTNKELDRSWSAGRECDCTLNLDKRVTSVTNPSLTSQ